MSEHPAPDEVGLTYSDVAMIAAGHRGSQKQADAVVRHVLWGITEETARAWIKKALELARGPQQ